jgi:hypothetical protein
MKKLFKNKYFVFIFNAVLAVVCIGLAFFVTDIYAMHELGCDCDICVSLVSRNPELFPAMQSIPSQYRLFFIVFGGFVGYVVLSSFDSLFDAFKTFFKKDNEEEKKS